MDWTKEQKDAIYKSNSNILVAAAAGSGKTAVLVERIIEKIISGGIDIDKLLVVTFTNAAASEMRERILEAIYKKIDEEPENDNLKRQIVLLGKANICTIHSFCLDVIKNNFFQLNIPASFRIAAEEEIEILKQEVIEDVFEKYYEDENEDFAKLVNTYTSYRGDDQLKEMVLKIYKFIQSTPFPEEWISEKIDLFATETSKNDFGDSIWGKILIDGLKDETIDAINSLKVVNAKLVKYPELEKYSMTIENDIALLKSFYEALNDSWDKAFEFSSNMRFKSWPSDKKITMELKDIAKDQRGTIKDKFNKKKKDVLVYNSEAAFNDIYEMYDILKILKEVIHKFINDFQDKKREKNIIDFNDIEHYALKILVQKNGEGKYVPTDVAKQYQEKFVEIAIDEYQDSNQVQEYILNTISKGNNLFMVGDVKQSIYKFRQACPELFLQKYESYSLDEANEKGLKIQLFKNFRSKENVINLTNLVFSNIMSKKLGDIEYNETEYLNLGANYENSSDFDKAEFDIINLEDNQENDDIWKDEESEEGEESNKGDNPLETLRADEIEAKYVAKRIEEIINSKVMISDKKVGLRPVKYKDIVILLRSTSRSAPVFEKELINRNIPVFSDSSSEYLDTIEIQTIMNVLKILDNPIDDISLVSVLRSQIGNFTDNEIVEIRVSNREGNYYNSFMYALDNLENETLKGKIKAFHDMYSSWKKQIDYLSLAELIWKIYVDTGFYNYVGLMPNGALRQANLKMLFERAKEYEKTSFKGLFDFIRFIERLKISNGDMSQAKIIGENEDVVRIMSIHKSKGLEFPIVFLSNTSKQINMQDVSSDILLHQEIGLGPQYINYEKRVEYSTSAKDAIKIIIKNETISEEMRILYVALTRAKEKLIITGTKKKYIDDKKKKEEHLRIYENRESEKLNPLLLKKFISYFDWLQLIFMKNDVKNLIDINEIKVDDIFVEESVEEKKVKFDFNRIINVEGLENDFTWKYSNEIATTLPIKSTVSKIKEMYNRNNDSVEFDQIVNQSNSFENVVPSFIDTESSIPASKRGTLMHMFLQNIDFRKEYDSNQLKELRDSLVYKKLMNEEEAKTINLGKVEKFLNSNLANKIKNASCIEKEKAFCMKINAKELYEEATDEEILVQGIIDLYAVDSDEKVILVDYKTDFVETDEKELVEKYKKQLDIYKKAIEQGLNKSVKEVYIYSLYLNKEISI